MIETALKVIFLFFVLVSIHEWGHFYFAKRAGILVREFAIGFGPKLFSHKKDETRYTLRLLPFGGYCRMAGEDPEVVEAQSGQTIAVELNNEGKIGKIYLDQLDRRSHVIQGVIEEIDLERELFIRLDVGGESVQYPVQEDAMIVAKGKETQIAPYDRQYSSKTVGARALSIVMGPVMNFLLAIVLFLILVIMSGVPTNVKMDSVMANQPAAKAGLKAGDIVISVNNEPIGADQDKFKRLIQASPDQTMDWLVKRGNKEIPLKVTPEQIDGTIMVGVRITADTRTASFKEVMTGTYNHVVNSTVGIMDGFKKLVLGDFKMDDLGGPVRIVEVTGQFASVGFSAFLYWMALLSLYLGIFNLLPFPALDGSRLVFLGLEAVRGKPVDPNKEGMVHFIGFAMLFMLMIAVTYNDILRLIKQ